MGVAEGHLELSMPEQLLDFLEVPPSHHQPGRARVPQVVEPEGLQLGHDAGAREGGPHLAPGAAVSPAEHEALLFLPSERGEYIVDRAVHGNLAPTAALRFLETDDAAGEVDALPGQAEDLAPAHPCVQSQRDDRVEERVL